VGIEKFVGNGENWNKSIFLNVNSLRTLSTEELAVGEYLGGNPTASMGLNDIFHKDICGTLSWRMFDVTKTEPEFECGNCKNQSYFSYFHGDENKNNQQDLCSNRKHHVHRNRIVTIEHGKETNQ